MSSDPEAPPGRRKRRWLRYTLWTLLAFMVVVAVFHRPILRAVIAYAGAKVADKQGLDIDFDLRGSVLGDLTVNSLKTTGRGETPWLPHANVEKFSLDYDLKSILRKDFEKAIESVTLHQGNIELDLRHLPKKTVVTPDAKVKKKTPLVWPDKIDIVNVDMTLTLVSGKRVVLRGLTLQVGEGMPGNFAARELRLEPNGLALGPLKAEVDWGSKQLTIRNLALPQNVVVEQLFADLTRWDEGAITAKGGARLGAARVDLDVGATGLPAGPQQMQANVQVRDLRAAELHTLGMPNHVLFDGGELSLQVAGNPKDTTSLKGGVQLKAANVRAAGVLLDQAEVAVDLDGSVAVLKSARLTRTGNTVEASGRAQLPSDLANWRDIQWQAKANGSLTNVTDLLAKPPAVSGTYVINASAEGKGATPTKVSGEIQAETPTFQVYRLPRLQTTFSLDGKEARVRVPGLGLGAGNTVTLDATLQLEDAMPVEVVWDLALTDPPALFSATGLPPPPQPALGNLQTKGRAKFQVQDLKAKDFAKASGSFNLTGRDLSYGGGEVQGIDLRGSVQGGQVTVQALSVQVDAANQISLDGTVGIAAPYQFEAKSALNLGDLKGLNDLLTVFKAPPMESGSLFGALSGTGQLKPWDATGEVSLTASKVKTGKMPEAADAVVDGTFKGTQANLGKFEAELGPWKVAAMGEVGPKMANLAELKVWQNETLLMQGRAKLPFDVLRSGQGTPMDVAITAKDLQVDSILKAAGIDNIPAGILSADIQLRGRGENASGKAHVEMRGIKVPKAPKTFGDASAVLDLTLENRRARILMTAAQPPLETMTLTADIPVNLPEIARAPKQLGNTPINARLEMPESDLSFVRSFAPDLIRSLPARASIHATVSGTMDDPKIDAAVDVSAPQVVWTKPDLPSVRDVVVRIRANDRILRVEQASVILAGGHVQIGGTIDATDLKAPTVDLNITAREALVYRDPGTSLRADGNLTCRGTIASSHVAGQVDLVRGRLFKEIDFLPSLSMPSDVPPLPPDTARRNTQLILPAFFKDWTFDVRARTRDQFLIAGNLANGAISGNASLTGTGAAPIVTGHANVDRLLLRLPYSVIKVTQGEITLDPSRPLDPALDIRGESRVGSTDVTIFVYGNTSDPKTRFTSIPPMPEADVVALLATGTSINGSSNEVAADAAGRAIFLFIKELYRKARNKPKTLDDDPPRMSVSVSPSAAERSDDNVQVAYELTDRWRVTARLGQSGRVRGFLEYLLRFGRAARAVEEKPNLAKIAPNAER